MKSEISAVTFNVHSAKNKQKIIVKHKPKDKTYALNWEEENRKNVYKNGQTDIMKGY